jgi:hypothetical protein
MDKKKLSTTSYHMGQETLQMGYWPVIPHIPHLMTLTPEVTETSVVNFDNHTK